MCLDRVELGNPETGALVRKGSGLTARPTIPPLC